MSEASVQKLKLIAAKLRASDTEGTFQSENSDDTTNASQFDSDTPSQASIKPKIAKVSKLSFLLLSTIIDFQFFSFEISLKIYREKDYFHSSI